MSKRSASLLSLVRTARLRPLTPRSNPWLGVKANAASQHIYSHQRWLSKSQSQQENAASSQSIKSTRHENTIPKAFKDFGLQDNVVIITGGAQGLGLSLAEGLVEAGAQVYCLDRAPEPGGPWKEVHARLQPDLGGALHYRQADVQDTEQLNQVIEAIASHHQRLDGVVAAAAIQQVTPAMEYRPDDVARMLSVNYTGVLMTATAAARQMHKYKSRGSICLVASMSGLVANKGLLSPVYNSSKAALIQLARNLAMEWSAATGDGAGGIRVNCLCPGHILTPMVRKNFEELPGLRETWEAENMMGRLAETEEFRGAVLFLLSRASSFMTGSKIVIDGGHTAW